MVMMMIFDFTMSRGLGLASYFSFGRERADAKRAYSSQLRASVHLLVGVGSLEPRHSPLRVRLAVPQTVGEPSSKHRPARLPPVCAEGVAGGVAPAVPKLIVVAAAVRRLRGLPGVAAKRREE